MRANDLGLRQQRGLATTVPHDLISFNFRQNPNRGPRIVPRGALRGVHSLGLATIRLVGRIP